MLKLHELPGDPGRQQGKKRIGRGEGSGRGKTAGKGHKGKQARSGSGKGAGFEGGQMPLIRRMPKFGFSRERFRAKRAEIKVGELGRHFDEGAAIDLEALRALRLVPKGAEQVKVLAGGEPGKRLTVRLHGFSAAARQAIEAAGGTCETV